MTIFQYLADRFYSKRIGNKQYIDVGPILSPYKTQRGKSRTTIINFFEATNIKYTIVKLKDDKIADIDISQYHPKTYKILLEVDSIIECETLVPLIEQTYRAAYTKALSELETEIQSEAKTVEIVFTPAAAPIVTPAVATLVTPSQYEIIELDESEKFKDINGESVDIEVRGICSPTGILFRAVDVSKYLGMKNLNRTLADTRWNYEKGTHWVKLYQYPGIIHTSSIVHFPHTMRDINSVSGSNIDDSLSGLSTMPTPMRVNIPNACQNTQEVSVVPNINDEPKLIWKRIYLTLNGLLKVMFSSTSANENVTQLRNWVIGLVFVHQFGSSTERLDLVETLTPYKKCLSKLSGIYLVRIGKVKDLRESMRISKDLYPSSKFDNALVFKFGRSDDIMIRFKQHCERTGYGKYSKLIELEWFVGIPPKLCSNAESELNKYFELHQFKFAFNDGAKDHTELIIIKPGTEKQHIKTKYFELIKNFPGETDALLQQMTQIKFERDQMIERNQLQHENELLKIKIESDKKDMIHQVDRTQLQCANDLLKVKSESDKKDLMHQVEILQLKLEMARLK